VSCGRAYEVDIAAYLSDPRAAEQAEFRAHYPTCAVCAAEVRAWTELAVRLGAGGQHPEPALLLRYEDARDQLDAAARDALRAHLAGCASCRDELVGLRTFAPALAPQPAETRSSFGTALRGLLWQPAFAYAVLFAVVAPLAYLQVTREPVELPPAKPGVAAPTLPAPQTAAPPVPSAPPGSLDRERLEQLRSLGYVVEPRAGARRAFPSPLELRTDASGAKVVTVSLDPDAGVGEVRVESADGARSLTRRFAAGSAAVELHLPADWPAGDYRVVVRSAGGTHEAGTVVTQ
jgi:hypothetical protein